MVYVSCMNKDNGAVARKSCTAACIGCMKCQKVCEFGAIEVANNLAFIDSNKCKLCRKCVEQCPTVAIVEKNFPPRKVVTAPKEEAPKAAPKAEVSAEPKQEA